MKQGKLDKVKVPDSAYITAQNITPDEITAIVETDVAEKRIADVYAAVHIKEVFYDDAAYDYDEGREEYKKAVETADAWSSAEASLRQRIFEIMQAEGYQIPEKEQMGILEIFMERNGYRNYCGW